MRGLLAAPRIAEDICDLRGFSDAASPSPHLHRFVPDRRMLSWAARFGRAGRRSVIERDPGRYIVVLRSSPSRRLRRWRRTCSVRTGQTCARVRGRDRRVRGRNDPDAGAAGEPRSACSLRGARCRCSLSRRSRRPPGVSIGRSARVAARHLVHVRGDRERRDCVRDRHRDSVLAPGVRRPRDERIDSVDGGSADDCHGHGTTSGTSGSTYGVAKRSAWSPFGC